MIAWKRRMSLPSTCQRGGQSLRGQVLAGPRIGQCRGVVQQRVDPDVDRLRGVPRHGDAPGHALPRDREILETRLDEGARLVHAAARQDEVGLRVVVVEQRLLEGGQTEEEVLLLRPLGHGAVLRAELPVDELLLAVELLAGRAVEAGVGALEEVAAVAQALDEPLHERLVLGVGRADEEVVVGVQAARQLAEALGDRVGPRLRLAGRRRRRPARPWPRARRCR